MILLLLACTGGDSAEALDACASQPTVSWESFGAGFVTEYCQTCHASAAPDRHGAPASVTFDSAAEVWAQREAVLSTTLGAGASMPPEGGVSDADKALLDAWLTCGVEGG